MSNNRRRDETPRQGGIGSLKGPESSSLERLWQTLTRKSCKKRPCQCEVSQGVFSVFVGCWPGNLCPRRVGHLNTIQQHRFPDVKLPGMANWSKRLWIGHFHGLVPMVLMPL